MLVCLGFTVVLASPVSAKAIAIRPMPVPDRVAQADTIVVGKVSRIEDKKMDLPAFPGAQEKVAYQVAVVKVDKSLLTTKDTKGLTDLKVGFMSPEPPAGGVIRPGRFQMPSLTEGQEVILFLKPHHTGEFQVLNAFYDVIDKNNGTFDKDLETVKKCVKLLEKPNDGLKSKDAQERLQTASMLINKYRMFQGPGEGKEEEIDKEQSKLILLALANAEWEVKPNPRGGGNEIQPQNLFFQLGLSEKDGFNQPQDFTKFASVAKYWLKYNPDKYRIKKFVAKKEEKKGK
jgi:hypothetical protein